jgi:hypothetical protein
LLRSSSSEPILQVIPILANQPRAAAVPGDNSEAIVLDLVTAFGGALAGFVATA